MTEEKGRKQKLKINNKNMKRKTIKNQINKNFRKIDRVYNYRLIGILLITLFWVNYALVSVLAGDTPEYTQVEVNTHQKPIIYDTKDYRNIPAEDLNTILEVSEERGFEEWERLVEIAYCESRFDKYAINVNTGGSMDIGYYQINEYYQDVSRECAFDLACATNEAISIANAWGNFQAWTCDDLI